MKTFWVTNASNMNVSLSDLALIIKAGSTVNLLDRRHYKLTIEQLRKSAESGSLYKKRNRVFVRKVDPYPKEDLVVIESYAKPSNLRSGIQDVVVEDEEDYGFLKEEKVIDFDDDDAKLEEADRQPSIILKK